MSTIRVARISARTAVRLVAQLICTVLVALYGVGVLSASPALGIIFGMAGGLGFVLPLGRDEHARLTFGLVANAFLAFVAVAVVTFLLATRHLALPQAFFVAVSTGMAAGILVELAAHTRQTPNESLPPAGR